MKNKTPSAPNKVGAAWEEDGGYTAAINPLDSPALTSTTYFYKAEINP